MSDWRISSKSRTKINLMKCTFVWSTCNTPWKGWFSPSRLHSLRRWSNSFFTSCWAESILCILLTSFIGISSLKIFLWVRNCSSRLRIWTSLESRLLLMKIHTMLLRGLIVLLRFLLIRTFTLKLSMCGRLDAFWLKCSVKRLFFWGRTLLISWEGLLLFLGSLNFKFFLIWIPIRLRGWQESSRIYLIVRRLTGNFYFQR